MRRWLLAGIFGAVAIGLVVNPSASASTAPAAKVLIVSYPRLQWSAVHDAAPAVLEGLFGRGAVASLSVRSADPVTTLADGYITIGAGNRASLAPAAAGHAVDVPGGGVVIPPEEVATARDDADDELFGAEPGALGDALARAGVATGVVGGPDAALALMDGTGRVAHGTVTATSTDAVVAAFDQAWAASGVMLVELADVSAGDAALESILSRVDLRQDLVLVVAPVAPGDAAALTAFGAAGPGIGTGLARTATTRRDGYVTLPDVGVTVLRALGIAVPDSMNGTSVTSGGGRAYDHARAGELADANTIAVFRDRTVGPVSVIYVAAQVVIYLIAIGALLKHRPRLATSVAFASMVVLALPAVTFLAGLVRYDRLGLWGYTMADIGAALVVAGAAWTLRRWHPLAPPLALAGLNWIVQIVDIVTGGRLQLDTTFGYSPIVAGRFQGYGNLAFAVVAGTAIVLATGVWSEAPGPRTRSFPGTRRDRWWIVAVAILAITIVADGWPAFGSDVGGVLACVPAFALVAVVLAGWRINVRRVAVILAGTVAVVAAFAAADLARPASERTHLGRFVADIGNGEAGIVLRRKLNANWHILTSSVWTLMIPVLIGALAVVASRRHGLLAEVQARAPGLRACLVGSLVVAVLGFAVNDSGIAIPAMMIGVTVPWLLLVTLRVAPP